MNNLRKSIVALGAGALTAPFGAFARQQYEVWRVGFLDPGTLEKLECSLGVARTHSRFPGADTFLT